MTAITIASPTIVRTMLAPPLLEWDPAVLGPRFSGVFSPPVLAAAAASPEVGHASAKRHAPRTAAAVAAARGSGINLVIEGRLRGRVVPGYRPGPRSL